MSQGRSVFVIFGEPKRSRPWTRLKHAWIPEFRAYGMGGKTHGVLVRSVKIDANGDVHKGRFWIRFGAAFLVSFSG